eukprot:scaffold706_cov418-Prasinococcus_capsulatus_cf.AAC.56
MALTILAHALLVHLTQCPSSLCEVEVGKALCARPDSSYSLAAIVDQRLSPPSRSNPQRRLILQVGGPLWVPKAGGYRSLPCWHRHLCAAHSALSSRSWWARAG